MAKKPKSSTEPSLRDKLSEAFLKAFQADFETHGVEVIQEMRSKDPTRYAELAGKLIMTTEQRPTNDLANAKSMHELGRAWLVQVGLAEPSDKDIEDAVAAHNRFLVDLEHIAAEFGSPPSSGEVN